MLGQVYGHDAGARERGLNPQDRLRFHQERSAPVMEQLHRWLEAQFAERKTEPNSGPGKAIAYLLRHWRPLTLFLRQAGAPIDDFDTLIWPPSDHLNWPPLLKGIYRRPRFGLSSPGGGPVGQESQGGAIRADQP
jgi:Transposase IS66 family